ncbi:MAG: hypothetical protein WCC22_13075 [Terriglobales bacterium]
MRTLAAVMLALSFIGMGIAQVPETKEEKKQREADYRRHQKEEKELAKQAAGSIPSVEIAAPVDKVKALILTRITQQLDFTLFNDSTYQLKSRRNVRWASTWDALALESTSSRPTKEELALTFVDLHGKTTVSSDRAVVREGEIGNTQRDSTNHIGKWNLELQQFLDRIKRDLEMPPVVPTAQPHESTASAPSGSQEQ